MLKKADIILAVFLITAGLIMSYALSFGRTAGNEVVISCDGEHFGTYSLIEDRQITVKHDGHTNKVTIKDGIVSMSFSDCHGQDCIHQGAISLSGENIICLPNKVVVEITGGDDAYDTISR